MVSLKLRKIVGDGASGFPAQPMFGDLFYKVPPDVQSRSSAGPSNNLLGSILVTGSCSLTINYANDETKG